MFRSQKINQYRIQKEQKQRKLEIGADTNKFVNEEKYFKNQQVKTAFFDKINKTDISLASFKTKRVNSKYHYQK